MLAAAGTGNKWRCAIPRVVPIRQRFSEKSIDEPRRETFAKLSAALNTCHKSLQARRVGICVGSRGIGRIADMVVGAVQAVRHHGGYPIIIPAMGSHGGAGSKGKTNILAALGVTEATVAAPVSDAAEAVLIGHVENDLPVYCQAEAYDADALILINRVKPHTDFRGEIESGLVKMAGIGLGASKGAAAIHARGYDHLAPRVKAAGELAINQLPVIVGLAILEGPTDRPTEIEAIAGPDIIAREKTLLVQARKLVPKLPFDKLDVLIVNELGKDISGTGLDPAVIGRYPSGKSFPGEDLPEFHRIAVLDLTNASAGNAAGIGLCDVTTRRLFKKIDFTAMYDNVITGKGSLSAKLPMVMESDHEAICVALLTCLQEPSRAHMALIRNTLELEYFLVSEPMVETGELSGADVVGGPTQLRFDEKGSWVKPEISMIPNLVE